MANAKALRDAIYEQTENNNADFQDKTEEYMNIEKKGFQTKTCWNCCDIFGFFVVFECGTEKGTRKTSNRN